MALQYGLSRSIYQSQMSLDQPTVSSHSEVLHSSLILFPTPPCRISKATALEALIGRLQLSDPERLEVVMSWLMDLLDPLLPGGQQGAGSQGREESDASTAED